MFDIHQDVWETGYDDVICDKYTRGLVEEFAKSPEGEKIIEQAGRVCWAGMMMYYLLAYVGETPADATVRDMNEAVFSLIPRKVTTEPESAEEIILELRAFWKFVDRQYDVPNAQKILKELNDDAIVKLKEELSNSSSFGMAKSFMTMGQQGGFDMTTQEGLDQFMLANNLSLLSDNTESPTKAPPAIISIDLPHQPINTKALRKKKKSQRKNKKKNRR